MSDILNPTQSDIYNTLSGSSSSQFVPPSAPGTSSNALSNNQSAAPITPAPTPQVLAGSAEDNSPNSTTSNVALSLSNTSVAADTHNYMAGSPQTLTDPVSSGDIITQGIPLTGLAIVNSFANTAIEVGNFFGAGAQKWSIENEVDDPEMQQYYKDHQLGVEAAGLITGSFIPGLAAIKGLKVATSAVRLSAAGNETSVFARATGLLPSIQQQSIVDAATKEINLGTGSLFGSLGADGYKAIAAGVGDQALQALVFQTASIATMKASPLLDQDSLGDVTTNIFYGTLLGAGIGGLIEGVGTFAKLNKAIATSDFGTKGAEAYGALGLGNYFASDRMLTFLDKISDVRDAELAPGTKLAQSKAAIGVTKMADEAKSILQGIAPDDDPEVSNRVFDLFYNMAQQGMSKEDMYAKGARLAKLTRIDDIPDEANGSEFYLNRFIPSADNVPSIADWNKLASSEPASDARLSLRYRLVDPTIAPKVGSIVDTITAPDGTEVQAYKNAQEAYAAGVDIFYNKDGYALVNPQSSNIVQIARPGESRPLLQKEELAYRTTNQLPEGSEQLLGSKVDPANVAKPSQTILNVNPNSPNYGQETETVVPVIGDYGTPKLVVGGIAAGQQVFKQDLSTVVDHTLPSIDLNARYVLAAQRGLKNGDVIDSHDVPFMEQLNRELSAGGPGRFDANLAELEKRRITLQHQEDYDESESGLPQSPEEMQQLLLDAKTALIKDTYAFAPKMGADEVAQRANVTQDFLANGMISTDPKEFIAATPDDFASTNHVRTQYDIGNFTNTDDGQILRGQLDVAARIKVVSAALDSQAADFFGDNWEAFKSKLDASSASVLGTGNKFLTSANADYGTLGQEMERIGRLTGALSHSKFAEVSQKLAPVANALRDDTTASAELGNFITVRQSTPEAYTFLPADIAAKNGLSADTAVLTNSLQKDKLGVITGWDQGYMPGGFQQGDAASDQVGLRNYYSLSPKVAAFERAQQEINDSRVSARNNWRAAQGIADKISTGNLYAPPIDTKVNPFFAYVSQKTGTAFNDGGVHVITAASQQELQDKISSLAPNLNAYTKNNLADFHRIEGDYQFDRNFSQSAVNSQMQRQGILNNILPDTRAETILSKYADWNSRQTIGLVRDHVELANAQLFAELHGMDARFRDVAASTFGPPNKFAITAPPQPYTSYIKTALAVGNADNFPLWQNAQQKLEAFADTAFNYGRYAFGAARSGLMSYEDASKLSQSFGLGNPYGAFIDAGRAYSNIANQLPAPSILSKFIHTANVILGNSVIRLDAFQQLIHMVATPVMLLAEGNSAIAQANRDLLTTELPDGSGARVPAISKVIFKAVQNFFDPEVQGQWDAVYKNAGTNFDQITLNREQINALTLPLGRSMQDSTIIANLNKAVDIGGRLSGSNFSRSFLHWVSADVGRQIWEAAGKTGQELEDNIATFANRAQGNYTAAQRPIAFQGPIGQAIGLFSTYQFNLMQQLFRYVGNGEGKTVAMAAALQQSLFGLQSLPGFSMINNHIIGNASGNSNNTDLYSATHSFFGKTMGDYLLYGALSNVTQIGLFTRGDLNPRNISILPVNPLDFPAISGGIRFVSSIINSGLKIANGGSIPASILQGLEHNALSRPLAGLAQLVQGYSTTSDGSLISAAPAANRSGGWADLLSAANLSRLGGARPLDEAIAMDQNYQRSIYKARDRSRIEDVGAAFKSQVIGNKTVDPATMNQFAAEYAAAGGNIQQFGAKVIQWTNEANVSIANTVFKNLNGSGAAKQQMMNMGGVQLPDFRNQGSQLSNPTWWVGAPATSIPDSN